MKQLKDTKIKYRIKIEVIQKHLHENAVHSNVPYRLYCQIDDSQGTTSTSFKYNKKGKNELIKFLRKECFL